MTRPNEKSFSRNFDKAGAIEHEAVKSGPRTENNVHAWNSFIVDLHYNRRSLRNSFAHEFIMRNVTISWTEGLCHEMFHFIIHVAAFKRSETAVRTFFAMKQISNRIKNALKCIRA